MFLPLEVSFSEKFVWKIFHLGGPYCVVALKNALFTHPVAYPTTQIAPKIFLSVEKKAKFLGDPFENSHSSPFNTDPFGGKSAFSSAPFGQTPAFEQHEDPFGQA